MLAQHLETFLQQARSSDHRLPLHVEEEMRAYLECGLLPYGFMRVWCIKLSNCLCPSLVDSQAILFSFVTVVS